MGYTSACQNSGNDSPGSPVQDKNPIFLKKESTQGSPGGAVNQLSFLFKRDLKGQLQISNSLDTCYMALAFNIGLIEGDLRNSC